MNIRLWVRPEGRAKAIAVDTPLGGRPGYTVICRDVKSSEDARGLLGRYLVAKGLGPEGLEALVLKDPVDYARMKNALARVEEETQ